MNDFEFYNPVKIIFGDNRINEVALFVKEYSISKRILLVVSNSSKENGVLDKVIKCLDKENIFYYILDGIVPNPNLDCVYKGKNICLENDIDFILAIGGASTIDTAKTISVSVKNNADIWSLVCNPQIIKDSVPLGVIITLYGSGTEMTNGAVISNLDVPKKRGFDSNYMYPKFSIIDPTVLKSCSRKYLLIGMTDMFSHVLEYYFEINDVINLSDAYYELLAKNMIEEFKKVKNNKQDNSKLMWLSTLAQNKFLSFGKKYNGEWVAHILAHEFCLKYDLPHGQVVAILFVSWLKFIEKVNSKRIINFGKNVFSEKFTSSKMIIEKIANIFNILENPNNLKELGVKLDDLDDIVDNAMNGKKLGKNIRITREDIKQIVLWSYYGI